MSRITFKEKAGKSLLLMLFLFVLSFQVKAQPPSGGLGTEISPYIIATLDDLKWIADQVNGGVSEFLTTENGNNLMFSGKYFKQTANIDAAETSGWNSGAGWTAIGAEMSNAFSGSYDGQGYTISNLYVNNSTHYGDGLFAYCLGATIKNLGLTNVNINSGDLVGGLVGYIDKNDAGNSSISNCYVTGSVTAQNDVGGLIGEADNTTIDNCYAECTLTCTGNSPIVSNPAGSAGGFMSNSIDCTISNSYASGSITVSNSASAGGFSGSAYGTTINSCYSSCTVSTSGIAYNGSQYFSNIGGFLGDSKNSNISNCYAIGSISANGVTDVSRIGGFVGTNGTSISYCYATSSIAITGTSDPTKIGGFIGVNFIDESTPIYGVVNTNCYWNSTIFSGNGCGTNPSGATFSATGKTTPAMQIQSTFTGWDFVGETANGTNDYWNRIDTKNNKYPYLEWQVLPFTAAVSTTAISTYGVTSATMGGNITVDGGATVTERGVVYSSTDATPTIGKTGVTKNANGTGIGTFSKSITGLSSNTTYYVCAYATNSAGTSYGTATSFSTLALPPTAASVAASGISGTAATLNGTVNPNNATSVVTFDYGTSTSYGSSATATQSPVTGNSSTSVSAALTGLTPNTTYHYRVKAVNTAGTTSGADETFTTAAIAPTAASVAASSISSTAATLNGTVNSNNASSVVTFEYGTSTSYGSSATATQSPVTGTSATSVSAALTGLTPNTTYHYRVKAVNTAGTTSSADETFTTAAIAPTAASVAASSVSSTAATLNGTVNANNATSVVTFEYGTSTSYGSSATATQSPVTGNSSTSVSAALTGLTPNTTYHYRVKAVNTAGTTSSADETFTTAAIAPTAASVAASSVSSTAATLNGTVNANNATSVVTFEYGTSTSYGSSATATQSPVKGTSVTSVSAALAGLTPNTTYHYRVKAVNTAGTTSGADETFTTAAIAPTAASVAASSISSTAATLNGTVNANNATSVVTFEYGTSTSYGSSATATQSPVTGTSITSVSAALTGLTPNTTYHYRVKAVNTAGTTSGADETFTTAAIAPTAASVAASSISSTAATLNGTVNANNATSVVTFEYGTSTSYGSSATATQSPVTGTSATSVSTTLTGLTSNTTYHYRVKAVNTAGTTSGADETFTTAAIAPTATSVAASSISITGATLNGTINANNASTTVTFEYGLTTSYGTIVTADQSPVTGSTTTPVSKAITGLTAGVTYYYRVVGVNAGGTTNGLGKSFTTPLLIGNGTPADPYQIATLADLKWVSEHSDIWNSSFIQTADIDAALTSTWNISKGFSPIGNNTVDFKGNYNGQSHTITGLTISRSSEYNIGLFGMTNNASIKNIGLLNCSVTGFQNVGSLVGISSSASAISNCYCTGSVSGSNYVGGLVGGNQYSTIANCYSTVSVTGSTDVGGLVGGNIASEITITNSFYDKNTSGQSDIGKGTPKTTAELKTQSTFTGWDFAGETANGTTDIWAISSTQNSGYPCFMSQITSPAAPTVTTQAVTGIATTTATGNGNITGLGVPNPGSHGVCWGTSANPTIIDNAVANKGGISVTGSFVAPITGLTPNTLYHVRAYATNSTGTVYGTDASFTTKIPTITSATYNASTGVLVLTCLNINYSDIISPAKMTLIGEGGTSYSLTTANVAAAGSTSASITLNATDKAAINQIFNKNGTSSTGATTYNLIAADDWDTSISAGDISDLTGNGITVSNVAVPTIASATYDAATGALIVAGTGFLKFSGTGNDINVSNLTITGEAGVTYALTTANVEISSGTLFTVPLNATDKAGVNQLINKNGASSIAGIAYNLAAAEDWDAGADVAVDIADLTGNGIMVSNLASPTVTTQAVSDITAISATGNGNITSMGVPNPTQYGVVWSTSPNPTVDLTTKTTQGTAAATGVFASSITGLTPNTTYYVKAYATNIVGTSYGAEVSFISSDIVPDAPTAVLAIGGNGQAIVSFTAPASNGGTSITGYTVTANPGGLTATGGSSPITIVGLTNGVSYTFTVTATNVKGTGTPSTASNNVSPSLAVQAITFNALPTKTYGDVVYSLAATSDAGLAISFASDNTAVASVSGNTVTIVGAGTANITASQGGNTTYAAATNVIQQLTVNKKAITVAAVADTKAYDGTTASTAVPAVGALATGDAINVAPTLAFDNAAVGTTHVLTASGLTIKKGTTDVTGNYDISYTTATGSITAKPLTITTPAVTLSKVYDGKTVAIVSAGTLLGVVAGDGGKVTVTAAANYDNASVGLNKTITVVYTLGGSAVGNYSAPANFVATGAEISSGVITLEPLSNPIPNQANTGLVLSYNVVTGGPTQYQITYEARALAVGMQNVSYTALVTTGTSGSISINVPAGTRPGIYKGSLQMRNDSGVESTVYNFELTVNIPTEYIVVKYNRVLVLDNSTKIFIAYQWYKDGLAIEGATKQFYRDPKGLVGTYSMKATTGEGEVLYSYPKVLNIPLVQKVTAYPSLVRANQTCTVEITDEAMELDLKGAELSVYSSQGIRVYYSTKVEKLNTIKLPIMDGMYSGRLTTADGQTFIFKVIVAN